MNSYKKELELLNITLPIIYFPFNSVSWSSDYSINQFVLYMKDFNHMYVRDWFDYPGGALRTSGAYHNRPTFKVAVNNVSAATNTISNEFTILFHVIPHYHTVWQTIFYFGDPFSSSFEMYQEQRYDGFKIK